MRTTRHSILLYLLLAAAAWLSCRQPSYPAALETALDAAGAHKSEVLKVIRHYSHDPADSMKLKAATWLIAGLTGHYYFDGPQLRHFLDYSSLVHRDSWHGEYVMGSFSTFYGAFSLDSAMVVPHLTTLNADSLIRHIDFSYKVWTEQPWSKHYPFEIYCEDVLPFFIDDEIPQYSQEDIYRQYSPIVDSVKRAGGGAMDACFAVNQKLKAEGWIFSIRQTPLPHLGISQILPNRLGNCREMADLATYVMRALGIPVGNDFLPQWPQRSMGHNWNVFFDTAGRSIMFLGAEDSPGVPHLPGTKKGKVYRYQLYANPNSLCMQRDSNEAIPDELASAFIADVTNLYAPCSDITVPLRPFTGAKHVYLSLFNNKKWVPVDWTTIKDGQGTFKQLERDIVYLPIYYTQAGIIPAAAPVEVTTDGSYHFLQPDSTHLIKTMQCTMICPVTPQFVDLNGLIDGRMQGANKPDFSDATDLYVITPRRKPVLYWNDITVSNPAKFRYLRFYGGHNWLCDINLAELAAYSAEGKLPARAFSPKKEQPGDPFGKDKAVDNDLTTTFVSDRRARYTAWLGLDFGRPETITHIRFAAGMHDKGPSLYVITGHHYQLEIWNHDRWNTLAEQTAQKASLTFKNVPANALFLLHDASDNNDERPFTYENNSINWF